MGVIMHKMLNFYAYIHKEKGQSRDSHLCSVLCISYETTKTAVCKEFFSFYSAASLLAASLLAASLLAASLPDSSPFSTMMDCAAVQ